MPTQPEVAKKIRFGLGELVSDNRHHEFEHLCRDLTKARIASNVLPPAGPVSAGGDQGRDEAYPVSPLAVFPSSEFK